MVTLFDVFLFAVALMAGFAVGLIAIGFAFALVDGIARAFSADWR